MARNKFLKPFGKWLAPQFFLATEGGRFRRPEWGAQGTSNFFFLYQRRRRHILKWAAGAPQRRRFKGGAQGADPSESQGNPAEGGCFASNNKTQHDIKNT